MESMHSIITHGYAGPMVQVRVVEVLAAISLTTDIAGGMPFEKGLRTTLVASEFGRRLALGPHEQTVVYQTALLRSIGCTSYSSENADYFDDDIAFQTALKDLDPGDPDVFARQLARSAPGAVPTSNPFWRNASLPGGGTVRSAPDATCGGSTTTGRSRHSPTSSTRPSSSPPTAEPTPPLDGPLGQQFQPHDAGDDSAQEQQFQR